MGWEMLNIILSLLAKCFFVASTTFSFFLAALMFYNGVYGLGFYYLLVAFFCWVMCLFVCDLLNLN